MMAERGFLKHSVAFRVTNYEWVELQKIAEKRGVTLAQYAKELLFKSAGLHVNKRRKRSYGQVATPNLQKLGKSN